MQKFIITWSLGTQAPRQKDSNMFVKMTLDIVKCLKDVDAAKRAIPDKYLRAFAGKIYPIIF